MSVYKKLNRVWVTLQSGDMIPTILYSEPENRKVAKTNGDPGFWYNDYADGVQLAQDGETPYPNSNINLNFVRPREEIIPALDVNPETGEVVSTAVEIPGELGFLFNRHQDIVAARQANGNGAAAVVKEAVTEASE